ncbi:hypothetical protein F444_21046 [Phytophthora nicotianae P1976]|uniref:Uncharacterized protein n=1 Tax=Phytophthora nicotianae P1976 TaxID=1317066 RepID=A0A080Z2D9_PHYNI|nr:hypothetical protein F444_21046 [Phytophthora nicotianae P1976]
MAPDERWCDRRAREEWRVIGERRSIAMKSGSTRRRSRRVPAAPQSGEEPVEIASPPEKTEFDSWGALDAYLKAYSAETYQSFRVRTNNKVTTRKKKIQDCGSTKPLVPEEWVYYSKTFVCTHAGKYKPRGKGKRKRQESRALDCDVQKGRVYVYDSMASSYSDSVRAVAQKMIMMLPDGVRPSARLVTHDPGLGVQSDSYNCGGPAQQNTSPDLDADVEPLRLFGIFRIYAYSV